MWAACRLHRQPQNHDHGHASDYTTCSGSVRPPHSGIVLSVVFNPRSSKQVSAQKAVLRVGIGLRFPDIPPLEERLR